jgi:Tol biopolymer transport system component
VTDLPPRLAAVLADRYTIERELGAGGMATVYLAQDLKHERKVALKVLRPELAAVLGAERFVQEIKTTASLHHPHILPLFDSGEADGFLYYVMPYIEGETLRDRLNRETQLGIEEAVRITTEVADALGYAHRRGVIHRDIKPENVLLHDGRPMVADFGIALAVSAAAGGRMTETGLSLGTPHYMSPEQATAEKQITARSDVYSLGSVLYEMLTGEPPHMGSSAQAIIMKIVTEEAQPVTKLRKSVPPNVAAAVSKALQKLPADRFESAKGFAEALTNPQFVAPATHAGTAARSTVSLVRRPAPTIALAALVLTALALAAWGWLRPSPGPPTIREWIGLSLRRPGGELPTSWPSNLAIASDGSAIVYADSVDDGGAWHLLLKEQGSPAAVPIPGTVGGTNPFFSPDGEWIGFATDKGLYRIPRNGGAPVKLSDSTATLADGVWSSGAWLDDGTIVFAGKDSRHLFQIDAEGGVEREVLAASDWIPQGIVRLDALPRGRGVLMTSCGASPCSRGALWMLDLARDTLVRLIDGVSGGWYLPTGHALYGRPDGTLFAQRLDLDGRELTGSSIPVMSGLATVSGTPALALSRAGTMLYAARGDGLSPGVASSLVWVDRAGTGTTLDTALSLPGVEQAVFGLSLAPDGSRLALVQNTDQGPQIFVKPMPEGPVTRLTFEGWSSRPAWSPDGRDLVYIKYRDGAPSVAVRQRADGAGAATVIAQEPRPVQEILLSPDGEWLVYRTESAAPGGGDILGRRVEGDTTTVPLMATPAFEAAPAISPDGRWLAYTSDEGGSTEVFVRPWPDVDRGKWRVSSEGGTAPRWSPNGRELFYRSGRQELMAAQVDGSPTFHVSETRTLFSVLPYLPGVAHASYAVSPDGQRFLFGQQHIAQQLNASRLILVRHWFTELGTLLEAR